MTVRGPAWCLLLAACAEGGEAPPDARPDAAVDARPPDAAVDVVQPDADPPPLYPPDRTQSPVTPAIARSLRAIAANDPTLNEKVFVKVGGDTTASASYLTCFAEAGVDLGARADLAPTLAFFEQGDAGGITPFERTSGAAQAGQNVTWALAGATAPVDAETMSLLPRYALIQFGESDVNQISIYQYAAGMLDLVDRLAARGIVPILSSVQPQTTNAAADALVPRFNLAARGIAQGRQIPFVDLHRELLPLPGEGLDADGFHLSIAPAGACAFSAGGLMYGYSVKNLVTLDSLARARAALSDAPPDRPTASLQGVGSAGRPFVIASLPFADLRNTEASTNHQWDAYTPCSTGQDESGPEYVYRLDLVAPATIRATVFVRGAVDIDVHVLDTLAADHCVARSDKEVLVDLDAGTFYLALDTFVPADGSPRVGEYVLTVRAE
jgi:hypothetical protein